MDADAKQKPVDLVSEHVGKRIVSPIYISSDDDDDDCGSGRHASDDYSNGDGGDCGGNVVLGARKRQKTRSVKEMDDGLLMKKPKQEEGSQGVVIPAGFLAPLTSRNTLSQLAGSSPAVLDDDRMLHVCRPCKEFWKAGNFEGGVSRDGSASNDAGMDRVRVHPKFLHSNATSHKWALGAFAELLDNALDEVCNGATYVHIDVLENVGSKTNVLVVEDNGGGLTPNKMRQCMSLGYSSKSKITNIIDGNGFKTSTMRLGADVIIFSRCAGIGGRSSSRSIGMLSYTFLMATGKEDIIVPMVDYEKRDQLWIKMMRSSPDDWSRNMKTILRWSPFASEDDLLQQFRFLQNQGTRILIYNLWEDDEGKPELDFETDPCDIQISGVNRDQKKIKMANQYPNSKHFLSYQHSLRIYASILYLRLPPGFRIILRGEDVKHHKIVDDMMLIEEKKYKPQDISESVPNESNMVVNVTIGFVRDASFHIDVQGFNVYHKNRLIKPFWRVWNATGGHGRGAIGVLEVNFIEPAHDKQGFECTRVLSRLEEWLVKMQKKFWNANCHLVGYAAGRHSKNPNSSKAQGILSDKTKVASCSTPNRTGVISTHGTMKLTMKHDMGSLTLDDLCEDRRSHEASPAHGDSRQAAIFNGKISPPERSSFVTDGFLRGGAHGTTGQIHYLVRLKEDNNNLRQRLEKLAGSDALGLLYELQQETNRRKSLETKLEEAEKELIELEKENEAHINTLVEDLSRVKQDEEELRKELLDASVTMDRLLGCFHTHRI